MSSFKRGEPIDLDKPTEAGEIREFARRDVATPRQAPQADISTLLQRVGGSSVSEIDRLVSELHTLRELLQREAARVQREITGYAHLSQSVILATKIISESLATWKKKTRGPADSGARYDRGHDCEPDR